VVDCCIVNIFPFVSVFVFANFQFSFLFFLMSLSIIFPLFSHYSSLGLRHLYFFLSKCCLLQFLPLIFFFFAPLFLGILYIFLLVFPTYSACNAEKAHSIYKSVERTLWRHITHSKSMISPPTKKTKWRGTRSKKWQKRTIKEKTTTSMIQRPISGAQP